MKLALLSLGVALVYLVPPCPAPFPRDDPRAVFNAFVIPWWFRVPFPVRDTIHTLFTGEPIGHEDPADVARGQRPLLAGLFGRGRKGLARSAQALARGLRRYGSNYRRNTRVGLAKRRNSVKKWWFPGRG